jgi:class 3 adenylate cyclase/tetratricopeptide (TPR) repeat protein
MDVGGWLRGLGLDQYEANFRENKIDADVLAQLTADDLKDIGVATVGDRRRLLAAVAALAGATPSAPIDPSEASPQTRTRAAREASPERRQLTVMFCDLVGSTALSARLDPEELRDVIGAYHRCVTEAVRRFDGFVAKYMGDGVLIYFGYPAAHEDDAERAVRAGLSINETIARLVPKEPLQVRVGIATGLAVVGDLIGEGASQEQAIVGETPNLAARLQALADPGAIVVAAGTRRLLGDWFMLHALGTLTLKGFSEPVEAFAVAGLSGAESRFESVRGGRLTGLVGREDELGLLQERWNLARDGEGHVALLSGEPGIGKSRILSELRGRLEQERARSLRFHCSPYYVNSAFYPIIDNFERALQLVREETPEEKLDKLEALVVDQYGRPREDVRFLAAMLSIPCDDRYGAVAMTPQRFKDETLRALVDTVEAIARQAPTAMLFEDIHWVDPTTLETLDLLIHRVRNMPLLLLISHRPEFAPRWSDYGHVTAMNLTKLTPSQSGALVSQLARGKALPADLLEQVLAKTDGVPLFIEELTKTILESGALKETGGHWEYSGHVGALAIPLTLRDSLMARLDRFAPVKEIAQIGAAIGREFSYELLAAVAPHAQPERDRALAQLVESGLAFQRGAPPDAAYTFKHALVQDAAYDSLLKRRRQELHAKIARVIQEQFPNVADTEPELLAHHNTEARQPEKAIPLWRKAGGLALKRMALAEAIAHLNKGLDLVTALPASSERDSEELDLRTLLGTTWMALKGWAAEEVWETLNPALQLAKKLHRADALPTIFWALEHYVLTTGRVAETLRWVGQILDAAEVYHNEDLVILGHVVATNFYFWHGDLIEAREHANQVVSLYEEPRHGHLVGVLNHDPKTLALLFTAQSTWMLGYPEQAVQISDIMDAHARRQGHPFDLGFALTLITRMFDHLGEPNEIVTRAKEVEELGYENRLPVLTEILVPYHSGIAMIRSGQLVKGMALLKRGHAAWEMGGGRLNVPYAKSALAEAMFQVGDVDGALDLIEECITQVERPDWEERWHFADILRIKGTLLSAKGDLQGAENSYVASLDFARRQQAKSWELRAATSWARLMRDQGRIREAYDLLVPIYGWFTEGFATKDLKEAKALLDELSDGASRDAAPAAASVSDGSSASN